MKRFIPTIPTLVKVFSLAIPSSIAFLSVVIYPAIGGYSAWRLFRKADLLPYEFNRGLSIVISAIAISICEIVLKIAVSTNIVVMLLLQVGLALIFLQLTAILKRHNWYPRFHPNANITAGNSTTKPDPNRITLGYGNRTVTTSAYVPDQTVNPPTPEVQTQESKIILIPEWKNGPVKGVTTFLKMKREEKKKTT